MIVCAVLAAGGSRRLGTPKQLVAWRGKALIAHAVEAARAVGRVAVVVGAARDEVERALREAAPDAVAHALREGAPDAVTRALREGAPDAVTRALREGAPDAVTRALREGAPDAVTRALREGAPADAPPLTFLPNDAWETGMASSVRVAARWARSLDAEALVLHLVDQPLIDGAHLLRLVEAYRTGAPLVGTRYADAEVAVAAPAPALAPAQAHASGLAPAQAHASGLAPAQAHASGLAPAQVRASGLAPAQAHASGLALAQVRASGLAPAQVHAPIIGAPALFSRAFFDALEALSGDRGAAAILRARGDVVAVPCPDGYLDIDTPADIDALRARD